jgi:hypothetical protein
MLNARADLSKQMFLFAGQISTKKERAPASRFGACSTALISDPFED